MFMPQLFKHLYLGIISLFLSNYVFTKLNQYSLAICKIKQLFGFQVNRNVVFGLQLILMFWKKKIILVLWVSGCKALNYIDTHIKYTNRRNLFVFMYAILFHRISSRLSFCVYVYLQIAIKSVYFIGVLINRQELQRTRI